MPYKIEQNTADVRVRVTGKTKKVLFSDSMEGMMCVLSGGKIDLPAIQKRDVVVESCDETSLLIDFINEVLSSAFIYAEYYTKVKIRKLKDTFIDAELSGSPCDTFEEEIKAVTYAEASIEKNRKGHFETTLVFDI